MLLYVSRCEQGVASLGLGYLLGTLGIKGVEGVLRTYVGETGVVDAEGRWRLRWTDSPPVDALATKLQTPRLWMQMIPN